MLTTRRKALICIIIFIVVLTRFPRSTAPIEIDLGYVRYQGIRNTKLGVTSFYGLQYAAPPTGRLRWQPPEPIEESGIHQNSPLISATSSGNICHQSKPTWQKANAVKQDSTILSQSKRATADSTPSRQSEDCLQLDVVTPSNPASNSLPVVVFIHGGGFVKGYAAQYDGSNFVSFSKGSVVWVQIHYRIGLFGFLAGDEIKKSGTANAGLLDQQLALNWVQTHIHKFGGDPKRVTIWGGSAGGASAFSQMVLHSGNTEPPFRAVIAEYPWWQPHHTDEVLNAQYNDLVTLTKCDSVACLRGLEESVLVKAQQAVYDKGWEAHRYGFGDFYFGPSVDGKVVPRLPYSSIEAGDFAKVPILVDRAGFEAFTFTNRFINQHFVIETYLQRLWPQATSKFYSELLMELYQEDQYATDEYFNDPIFQYLASLDPQIENNSAFFRTQTIVSDATINCPTRNIARALTKAGQNAWKMQFNSGTQLHATITKDFLLSPKTTHDVSQLRSYFLSFITSLDPNGPVGVKRPVWPKYADDHAVLKANNSGIFASIDTDAGPQCDFFASNHEMVGN